MHHRTLFTAALVLGIAVGLVAAQDKAPTKTATGAVTVVKGTTLSVDTGKATLQFITTAKTAVNSGGPESSRDVGGKPIPITQVVHQGDQVSVKYTEADGKLTAVSVDVLKRQPASAQPQK